MADRALAARLLVLLAVTSCASGEPADVPGARQGPGPTASASQAATTGPHPGETGARGGSRPTAGRPSSSGPAAAPATTAPFVAPSPTSSDGLRYDTLAVRVKPCVQPGQTQVLTFTLRPKMGVVVNTRYADDKDGQEYGGFDYKRFSDSSGTYTLSWVVSPVAPLGAANSLVGAVDRYGRANGRADFTVAKTC